MRLRLLLACAAAAAAAVSVPVASAEPGFKLSRLGAGGAPFPDRAYALSFPENTAPTHVRVRVSENGERVSRPTVTPALLADSNQLAVALVVDTSRSMRGAGIRNAMAAARAFAGFRNPQQKIAVVGFDNQIRVLLPFTSDGERIQQVLDREPTLRYGSHIYDALARTAELFKQSGIETGSIIMLSDGADVGSARTRTEAAAQIAAAHTQLYSVLLKSHSFEPEALRALARNSGGSFAVAESPDQLPEIYDRLGFEITNAWIVRYRSLAGPRTPIRVAVKVDGYDGVGRDRYVSPALPPSPSAPYQEPLVAKFWRSGLTFVLAVLLASALLAATILVIVTSRDSGVRARVAEFVSIARRGEAADPAAAENPVEAARTRSYQRRWDRFAEELEIAQISVSPRRLLIVTAIATVALMLFLYLVSGPIAAVLALLLPLGVRAYLKRRLERRRRVFVEQLADNLAVVAAALRAGHSLVGALSVVIDDAPEPARSEFRRIVAQEQLGVPLEDAIDDVARRMACRDLEQVSIVAAVGRESGGNTAEVLDRVVETVRERGDLRRLIRTLTAQGRLSRWIVSLLPAVLLLAILVINPKYLTPLFDRSAGRVLLGLATVMVIAGSLAIRRIVNIRV